MQSSTNVRCASPSKIQLRRCVLLICCTQQQSSNFRLSAQVAETRSVDCDVMGRCRCDFVEKMTTTGRISTRPLGVLQTPQFVWLRDDAPIQDHVREDIPSGIPDNNP